ncbi:WYL domain-containing protein [Streptomyces sp. NPDC059832]
MPRIGNPRPARVHRRPVRPGGSTVEYDTEDSCRLTLGAWSWPGLAGLLLTFDADITDIEPPELRQALHSLHNRIRKGLTDD